jgi:hypothetical protein
MWSTRVADIDTFNTSIEHRRSMLRLNELNKL